MLQDGLQLVEAKLQVLQQLLMKERQGVAVTGLAASVFGSGHPHRLEICVSCLSCPSVGTGYTGLEPLGPPHNGITQGCEYRQSHLLLLRFEAPDLCGHALNRRFRV